MQNSSLSGEKYTEKRRLWQRDSAIRAWYLDWAKSSGKSKKNI
jgi:hypothetical protein